MEFVKIEPERFCTADLVSVPYIHLDVQITFYETESHSTNFITRRQTTIKPILLKRVFDIQ